MSTKYDADLGNWVRVPAKHRLLKELGISPRKYEVILLDKKALNFNLEQAVSRFIEGSISVYLNADDFFYEFDLINVPALEVESNIIEM